MTHIAIIGASSRIAEHTARLWNHGDVTFFLVGRSGPRLEVIARDLEARNPRCTTEVVVTELTSPDSVRSVVDRITAAPGLDIALLAQGTLPDQDVMGADVAAVAEALAVNAVSPVLFAQAIVNAMAERGSGTLAILGSVAGDRGRRSNYLYGAAKSMVATAAQGMQHRLHGSAVRVVLIKPGPTDTPMTAELKARNARLAPAPVVARLVVRAVEKGSPVAYAPPVWRLVMLVVRSIPARIFGRLNI